VIWPLCHRRFRVISGKSSTRWNSISGAQHGGSALGRAALKPRPGTVPAVAPYSESALVFALTGQINRLKKKEHRQRVAALQAALKEAHGENLDLRRELARRGAHAQPAPQSLSH